MKIPTLIASISLALSGATNVSASTNDDWLTTRGNQVVDQSGNPVWLTGANWFGFNTTERTLHGIWSVNMETTLQSIADRGINILRVPISTELIWEWRNGQFSQPNVNLFTNPNLTGLNNLEVFDYFLVESKKVGLKVLLDVHSAEADNTGHLYPLWYKDDITPEIFYSAWEWIIERHKNDDTIIAADIKNEPHGRPWADSGFAKWDNSSDVNNFKYACETASKRILAINPNMLVLCEGIEAYPVDTVTWTSNDEDDYHKNWWGGNLRGVRDYPIDLGANQAQLLYSPHDYGPLVFEQPWFYPGFNKDTLYNDLWRDNWMYIHEDNIAPLLIGEWGGFIDGGDNEKWMVAIRDLIVENQLHHTFWAINPNSGDTGGLLENNWIDWDEDKYAILEPSLWQKDGKFVGLDHQIPLGSAATGITVTEFYGDAVPSVQITSPTANSQLTTGSNFTLSYNAVQLDQVNVYVGDTLVVTNHSGSSVSLSVPAQLGAFTVRVVGVDENGSETEQTDSVNLVSVEVIEEPATLAISSPSNNSTYQPGDNFTLTVTLDNASGYQYSLNGQTVVVSASQSATLTAPTEEGSYVIDVVALDAEGNALDASDSVSISVAAVNSGGGDISCEISDTNIWSSGFVLGEITLSNNGATAVSQWTATVTMPSNASFANGWKAVFSQNGNQITASNLSYNADIQPGESVSFGLKGSYSGTFELPSCTVN